MRVDTGSYTGDGGVGGKDISLTNCSGDCSAVDTFIMVVAEDSDSAAYFTTDKFDTDYAKILAGAGSDVTGLITGLTTAQFTVDGTLNTNTANYLYVVIQYDGVTRDIETGQYTGNTLDNQTGLCTFNSFSPDACLIGAEVTYTAGCSSTANDADETCRFDYASVSTNWIQAFNAANIELGSTNEINRDTYVYNFVVIKNVTSVADFREYTGDAATARQYNSIGFTPDFLFINHDSGDDIIAKEITTDGVDDSHRLRAAIADVDKIQDFITSGVELGTHAEVNGSAIEYYPWSFKKSAGTGGGGGISIPVVVHHLRQQGMA